MIGTVGAHAGDVVDAAQHDVLVGEVGDRGVDLLDDLGELLVGGIQKPSRTENRVKPSGCQS